MALPWYAAGRPRPQHAQYSGWQQADAIRARTATLKNRQPAAAPKPSRTPQRWQQDRPPEQRKAGLSPWSASGNTLGDRVGSWWSRTWRAARDSAGEPGKADDIQRARAAQETRMPRNVPPRYVTPSGNSRGNVDTPFSIDRGLRVTNNPDFWTTGSMDLMPGSDARQAEQERQDKAADREQRMLDDATEAAKIRASIDRQETMQELTLDEWNAMTPRQQAAVQFNTDLIAAVNADRALRGYTPTETEQEAYDELLTDRFGTTYSEAPEGIKYAPNVAGLLQNVDMNIPMLDKASLDDFLKLDVAIGMDEIRRIDEKLTQGRPTQVRAGLAWREGLTPENQRLQMAQHLAAGQQRAQTQLAEQLGQGEALLASMTGKANTEAAVAFGAENVREPVALSDDDLVLKNFYLEALAANEVPLDEITVNMSADMADKGLSEERQRAIYDTILMDVQDAVSNQGWQFQLTEGLTPRNPMDTANALGAPMLGVGS